MLHSRVSRRAVLGAAIVVAKFVHVRRSYAQPDWDSPPEIRPTSSEVATDLLHGPHYVLGPTVTTYAYMNRYTAISDYGQFVAPSDAGLRRLIREIAAITQLKEVQETDAFGRAAMEAGKSSLRSAKNLIDNPVSTLSAIPEGIGSIFDRRAVKPWKNGITTVFAKSASRMTWL